MGRVIVKYYCGRCGYYHTNLRPLCPKLEIRDFEIKEKIRLEEIEKAKDVCEETKRWLEFMDQEKAKKYDMD